MTDRKHFKCLLWKALWGLAALAFLGAVATGFQGGPVLDVSLATWFWLSLTLGVLAIPIKLDCHACSVCNVGGK